MRTCYDIGTLSINATPKDTACAFNNPQVFPQCAAIHINPKLLRPEGKQASEAVGRLRRIAIVPAIDQTDDLGAPIPVPSWMNRSIHRRLHVIKIVRLAR